MPLEGTGLPDPMRNMPLTNLLRSFFVHLYTDFAWSYDLVAALVSLGLWQDWINTVLPFVRGRRILELAFGTGMLQRSLRAQGWDSVLGLDESRQMVQLARGRLERAHLSAQGLARGRTETLPYASGTVDTIVATFPSEFMFSLQTLNEIRRVLAREGRLVIVPAAWIIGKRLLERATARLFEITHQSPSMAHDEAARHFAALLNEAGFASSFQIVRVRASLVLVLSASNYPTDTPGRCP